MLDETLRRRVAEIAGADRAGLEEAASERVIQRIVAEGPAIVRRARRNRLAVMTAGPLLAAAAAAALLVRHPHGAEVRGETATTAVRAVVPSACAGRTVRPGAAFIVAPDGARLDLGTVATAMAEPNTDVRVVEVAPCRTVIALGMGRVTVHAKDLGGGELMVRARDGEIVVHGTIFAVTQTGDSLTVEVAEGRVGVKDHTGEHTVSAGERILLSAVGMAEGALSADRLRTLRAAVVAPVVVGLETLEAVPPETSPQIHAPAGARAAAEAATPPPSSSAIAVELASGDEPVVPVPNHNAAAPDLLAQADEARHGGDFASARELYRRAAAGQGPTAEAAWVALARMELSLGHAALAREATKQRQQHFGQGTLAPEALWIDVRTYRQTGDVGRARTLAEELVRRWPSSPQARAAEQWLSSD